LEYGRTGRTAANAEAEETWTVQEASSSLEETMKEILEKRRAQCAQILDNLVAAQPFPFDDHLTSRVPEKHGLYAITRRDASGAVEYLYAGRSKTGATGLRRRICNDHFNDGGGASGSDLPDLVAKRQLGILDGASKRHNCEKAAAYIREHYQVQWVEVEDSDLRCWAEHYVLSILRPTWSQ
jgi:hypothetical protein